MGRDLVEQIKALTEEVGYAACGITTADPFEEFGRALDERMTRFPEAAGPLCAQGWRSGPMGRSGVLVRCGPVHG